MGSQAARYAVSSVATNADSKGLKDQLVLTVKTVDVTTPLVPCDNFDGSQLYTGDLDSTAGKLVGDSAQGAQAGDRTLAVSASETLCFRGSSLVTILLVAVVVCLALIALPRVFGYGTLVVRSGSMAQTAPVGSLVLMRPLVTRDVQVGDVILIRREGATTPPVLHRVVTLGHRGEKLIVATKGDSNATPDPEPYILRGTTMTPVLAVPHVGRAVALSRTPLGWTLLIALPATLLLWFQLVAIWFPARRRDGSPMAGDRVVAPA